MNYLKLLENFPEKDTPRASQKEILRQLSTALEKKTKFIILQAPTGSGKAQPFYSKIKTPTGWITMGEAKVGDVISTPSGGTATITHIHLQGKKEIFEVTFQDGRSTRCCIDHLWKIHSHNFANKWKIVDTTELIRQESLKSSKIHIPLLTPNRLDCDRILPIDPYILGCLLGDGSFSAVIRLTTADTFIVEEFKNLLDSRYVIQKINKSKYGYVIVQKKKQSNRPFKNIIRDLGLLYTKSDTKFIPNTYKSGSYIQKIRLIQGLLDTDGHVGKKGGTTYSTTSKQLADDLIEMVRSIGGIAKIIREYIPTCNYKGEKRLGKKAYTISIRYSHPEILLRLPRKKSRCPLNYQYVDLKLKIKNVSSTNQLEECKCITINSIDQLYITDDYIVTHNSHVAATLSNVSNSPDIKYTDLLDSHKMFDRDIMGKYQYSQLLESLPPFGCMVLTVTKALQNQYDSLFENSNILKGKQNYVCNVDNDFDCDLAPCLLTPKILKECKDSNRCAFLNTRIEALKSKFAVLNYSAYLSLPDFVKKRQFMLCDEASELEDQLVKYYSCEIEYKLFEDLNIKKLHTADLGEVHKWLTDLSFKLDSTIGVMNGTISKSKNNKRLTMSLLVKLRIYKNLYEKIILILQNWFKAEYIVEFNIRSMSLRPLYVNTVAQEFFENAETVILMSGTIIDHKTFAGTLGITEYEYIEVDSEFDASKSPVYCNSKHKLTYKNMDKVLPILVDATLKICDHHTKDKGIIHTHTFKITEAFQKKTKGNKRFLYREPGITNEVVLTEHFIREDATVIISPSLGFGTDLSDDAGRFSIIVKTPFLPLGDLRVKKLAEKNQKWYEMKALVCLVQMCGRTTRNINDYSETYILDGTAADLLKRNWNNIPKWFQDRIK